jgi:hypothetical protein
MARTHMTIANLAEGLRGIPRTAVVMIDTPDGPKPLRMVRGAQGRTTDDGAVTPLPSGASTSTGAGYIVILMTDRA